MDAPETTSEFRERVVPPSAAPAPLETKLNVNTASQGELENIVGIGPAIAQRIIAVWPFKTADDLRSVKGIGNKSYVKIRPSFN